MAEVRHVVTSAAADKGGSISSVRRSPGTPEEFTSSPITDGDRDASTCPTTRKNFLFYKRCLAVSPATFALAKSDRPIRKVGMQ
jgi:hypothetical protein